MKLREITYILLAALLAMPFALDRTAAQQPAATDLITNGDVNGDGMFDIFDIMHLERTVSLGMEAKDEELSAGDVDGNGRLDKFDLMVLNEALERFNRGTSMFDAVKEAVESDLSKSTDNVETYLDLAKFYKKEQNYTKSRSVLESVLEALETGHPLYNSVLGQLELVKDEQAREMEESEDFLNQDIYQTSEDMTGKTSLRNHLLQLKGKLSKLMDDQQFGAHYNNKRVKSQLGDVMDDMLRKVNQDQYIDASAFDQFNSSVRGILENPDNIVKQLDSQQRSRIRDLVDTSTSSMRQEAVKIKQDFQRTAEANTGRQSAYPMGETILNRNESLAESSLRSENMDAQGRVPADAPVLDPDTISIVSPQYKLTWDVSNILGAKNAALEIGKVNAKFSNPRGTAPDEAATLFYTPALGTVKGERRGSAIELEGVGNYQYRVAALNTRGELISRFSDAAELVVVYNNLDIAATTPEVNPKIVSPQNPEYTFQWDVSNIEGARDAAVEISKPDVVFGNQQGRARDRINTFFFNPSLGRTSGSFSSSITGLSGPGTYQFRVIAVSANEDFMGMWSEPATLIVASEGTLAPVPAPEPVKQDTIPRATGAPSAPSVLETENGFNIKWNVSDIGGATGVNFELARLRGGKNAGDGEVDEVIIAQVVDSTLGRMEIDGGLLDRTGLYQARVAAVDSAGNLLTNWSKPALINIQLDQTVSRRQPAAAEQQQPQVAPRQAPQTSDTSAVADASEQQAPPPPPTGKNLEVSRNNTPLYEKNNPSSPEVASLQKGEKLIHVGTDGLWQNVYYPLGGKYGWVLSFNVTSAN